MTIGQIKCFIAVANEHSFAKAANALFISQPAVSKSIATLEKELNYVLIDRGSHELRLTLAGAKLYDLFVKMGKDYQNTINEINQFINASDTTVRIGCSDVWNPDKFYSKISRHFSKNYSSVCLEFEDNRLPDLLARLQAEKVDIILTYELYRPLQYGFTVRHLTDVDCRVLYSKTYFKSVKSLADLNGTDILIFDVDIEKKFGMMVKKICSDYGFITEVKNCSRFESAVFNMACGKGVLLHTEWDNISANTPYDSLPFPYKASVNMVYKNVPEKPFIQLVADELVKIFALENAKQISKDE